MQHEQVEADMATLGPDLRERPRHDSTHNSQSVSIYVPTSRKSQLPSRAHPEQIRARVTK